MTAEEIIERRLFNQHLTANFFHRPEEMVAWLGAVQSQDFSGGIWALSQRLNFRGRKQIEEAFNKGTLLRTHVLRPTWHFVTPEDIRWMLELTETRVKSRMSTYNKILGLDTSVFEQSEKIIEKELKGNNYLTRGELEILLKKNGMSWRENGLAHIISSAELNSVICSGPKKNKLHTYALLSERVPASIQFSREDALKELTRRYFQSHGPAQLIDYVWWSGLLTSEARKGIELHTDIRQESVKGNIYYFFDNNYQKPIKSVFLLPNYDEYIVAYRDRQVLTEHVDKTKLDFRQNSLFNNVILIHGKIEGVWRRMEKTKRVLVETRLFRTLTKKETEELSTALHEYAQYLGLALETAEVPCS